MALMILAGLNLVFFYANMAELVLSTPAESAVQGVDRITAGLSLAACCGVIVAGRLITCYRPPYHWCLKC